MACNFGKGGEEELRKGGWGWKEVKRISIRSLRRESYDFFFFYRLYIKHVRIVRDFDFVSSVFRKLKILTRRKEKLISETEPFLFLVIFFPFSVGKNCLSERKRHGSREDGMTERRKEKEEFVAFLSPKKKRIPFWKWQERKGMECEGEEGRRGLEGEIGIGFSFPTCGKFFCRSQFPFTWTREGNKEKKQVFH